MVRKLILAAAAVVALAAEAQAANTVTTVQIAPFGSNISSTTQIGTGNNTALLAQFAGGFNNASATQVSANGNNVNAMFQDSESSSNTATVGQTTFGLGVFNFNAVIQVP